MASWLSVGSDGGWGGNGRSSEELDGEGTHLLSVEGGCVMHCFQELEKIQKGGVCIFKEDGHQV